MARMVILGTSGTGKSWYAGSVLESAVPTFDFAVHLDPENEEIGLSAAEYDPLYKTLFIDRERYESLNILKVMYRNRRLRIVPEGLTSEEREDLYGMIAAAAMTLAKDMNAGSVLVSCDEAHNVLSQSLDERVERLTTGGRKHEAEVIHISQRPQLLPTTVLSQVDKAVYFRIGGDNDLDKIDKQSEVDASRLKSLGKRECIIEDRDSGEWTLLDTETVSRQRPHYSKDDGLLDDQLPV